MQVPVEVIVEKPVEVIKEVEKPVVQVWSRVSGLRFTVFNPGVEFMAPPPFRPLSSSLGSAVVSLEISWLASPLDFFLPAK